MKKLTNPRIPKDLPEQYVNVGNALVRGAHALTLSEKRIIACALATLDSKSGADALKASMQDNWGVKLLAADYMDLFNLPRQVVYEQLRDGAESLRKKAWTIIEGKKTIRNNWLSRIEYHSKEGWIEVYFSSWTTPHLLSLRKNFTSYKLGQASALRSIYSWRLMECLQSWKSTGVWHVPIEEFHHAMDAPDSLRKDFGQLRVRVITPAIKELRDTENLIITCKPLKAGRKVVSLIFEFEPHRQNTLFQGEE
jgi:plasmid replication initiation protein